MSGPIRELSTLLARMSPQLQPRAVAILQVEGFAVPNGLQAGDVIGTFREAEGLTLYVDLAAAEAAGAPIALRAAWITMNVLSALDAVGFTAAFSSALAQAGIACNVVAGARRDHVFVPLERAGEAMRVLLELQTKTPAQSAS